jgi:F-type H+-transporting ATPase subunit b
VIVEFLAAAEGGISLLDVNPGLAIWTAVTFLLVFLALYKLAWGPISNALDARAEKIHGDLDRADSLRKDAEAKLTEYMTKLEGLKTEGQDLIGEAKKQAERLKEEILETARKESEALRAKSAAEIKLATDAALQKLQSEVTNLSIAVASQVLGKAIQAQDHKKLIEETVSKLKSVN